jgi:hypothetical protein
MIKRLLYSLVLMTFILTSCTILGGEKTPEGDFLPQTAPVQATPTVPQEVPIDITSTPTLINTPIPTETELAVEPSPVPEWYVIQPGTPLATYNTPHEAAGCSWLGVGGQVFGPDSAPQLGVNILVGGTLDGYQVGSLGTTGMETNIGEGGYEVTLADHPVDSSGTVWIQVVNSIGNPLSEKIYFDTVNDCARNFILINFVRYGAPNPLENGWNAYFPILINKSSVISTPMP